ncbi:hypothetical protein KEM52_005821 [Ascosphaera acerosa]|nr:hypothetical protein KEM52_005821 [Ascosphaera acerosa]
MMPIPSDSPRPASRGHVDRADASDSDGEGVFYDAVYPPDEEARLLEQATSEKTAANKLFATARYSEALGVYDRALSFVPTYLDYDIAVIRSNIAACHLKLREWKEAAAAATASLACLDKLDPSPQRPEEAAEDGKDDAAGASPGAMPTPTQSQSQPSSGQPHTTPTPPPPRSSRPDNGRASGVVELPDDADESATLARMQVEDQRREDINRIRAKSLMRRARARMEMSGWSNLEGAAEDYKRLLELGNLPPADTRLVKAELAGLPAKIAVAREKEMGEMMGKLKELGNGILKPFGLSTDNFKFIKDEKTGGYNMSFERIKATQHLQKLKSKIQKQKRPHLAILCAPITLIHTLNQRPSSVKTITMALFSPFSNDLFQPFQPLFQMLDDDTFSPVYPVRRTNAGNNKGQVKSIASFMPRFDVRESKDAYHLDGELPGLVQKDVELSFTDPHTLLVKGTVNREYHKSSDDDAAPEKEKKTATVEDAGEDGDAPVSQEVAKTNTETGVAKKTDKPAFKYWVSERSSGSFHRTFNFPAQIDQDNVKASLKDGILSVTVPKAPAPTLKKIEISSL